MATRLLKSFCILTVIAMIANACVNNTEAPADVIDTSINLKWFSGSFKQTDDEVNTGFAWALSSLGAQLSKGAMDSILVKTEEDIYEVNLLKAGFRDDALKALSVIISTLKSSDAYKINDYVEMGRFIMLTLNSSYHYYKITGAPRTLSEFRSKHDFQEKKVRVINSGISDVPRLIEIANADKFEEIAFISIEGKGKFEEDTFVAKEFEVLDFMPNGQARYMIYDESGKLKAVADPTITRAGKPSKCLWCHETTIQPFFTNNPVLEGENVLSEEEFLEIRQEQILFLAEYRASLNGEINYLNLQDHSFMEYLYIDFMEPSAERLSREWDISIEDVRIMTSNLNTHTQSEYNIENLYDRSDLDQISPFTSTLVPENAREVSINEPDFFLR